MASEWLLLFFLNHKNLYEMPCELVRRYYEKNSPEMFKLHYPHNHTSTGFSLVRLNDDLLLSFFQIADILELYWFGDEPESIKLLKGPKAEPRTSLDVDTSDVFSNVTFSHAIKTLR